MQKRQLPSVTLLGADCVDIDRLILAADICQKHFDFATVKLLTSLPNKSNDPRVISIKNLDTVEKYSEFMITDLDSYVDTDYVLIIQHDGFILNPQVWTDEFLKYDYIGAPWLVADWLIKRFDVPKELLGQLLVGNGGFSLRTKKLTTVCANLASEGAFEKYQPEDLVLCCFKKKLLESHGISFAPGELAERFSFEAQSDKNDMWDGQFGFHGLLWTDISKWLDSNPEYKSLIKNNLRKNQSKVSE